MRLALLADVHGNLEALEAVVSDLEERAPDARIACAGDIVGYGPDPEPCLRMLVERAAVLVAGNHEEMVLGRRDFSRCVYAGIRAALWTRTALSRTAFDSLAALPRTAELAPGVWVCHGAPSDAGTYVSDAAGASDAIADLSGHASSPRLLVCGHTHHASFFSASKGFSGVAGGAELTLSDGETSLLNPGSVGQARDGRPLARYALLDLERSTVRYLALPYEHAKTLKKLADARLVSQVVMRRSTGIDRHVERAKSRFLVLRDRLLPAPAPARPPNWP